jgi:hypothetical protein
MAKRTRGGAGLQDLREELRTEPPEAVAGLPDERLADLAGALRAAREHQAAEMHDAVDAAYDHLPRLIRIPVRKIFGG